MSITHLLKISCMAVGILNIPFFFMVGYIHIFKTYKYIQFLLLFFILFLTCLDQWLNNSIYITISVIRNLTYKLACISHDAKPEKSEKRIKKTWVFVIAFCLYLCICNAHKAQFWQGPVNSNSRQSDIKKVYSKKLRKNNDNLLKLLFFKSLKTWLVI